METVTLSISGMTCGHCVTSVREALAAVPGVQVQNVRVGSAEVRLDASQTGTVLAAVQDAGYEAAVDASVAAVADAASACAPQESDSATGDPAMGGSAESGSAGCACCAPSAAPTRLATSQTASRSRP